MLACPYCAADLPDGGLELGDTLVLACPRCSDAVLVMCREDGVTAELISAIPPLHETIAPGSVMEGVFNCLSESIEQLPTLPAVPQQVIGIIHDPITSTEDLARIINGDPALSLRVLKLSNSVLSGGRHEITDLRLACARLGFRTIANLAHLVAQGQLYRTGNPAFREMMENLWGHSVTTARLCELISRECRLDSDTPMFLAGLAHNMGKPVLLDAITIRYRGRAGRLRESWNALTRALEQFAPYAGLRAMQHWKLPLSIRVSAFFARHPEAAPEASRPAARVIALASEIANASGFGIVGNDVPEPVIVLPPEGLPIDQAFIDRLVAETAEDMEPYLEFSGSAV